MVQMYWYARSVTQRITDGGEVVPGVYFPAFIHNGDHHYLANIVGYKDGMVNCWGLVTFEEFRQKVREGWVVTSVPEGATVRIHNVAGFTVSGVSVLGQEEEFLKDVANAIEELNGRPTAQARLIETIAELRKQDTPELRKELRRAYTDLPAYLRTYFGKKWHTDLLRLLDAEE